MRKNLLFLFLAISGFAAGQSTAPVLLATCTGGGTGPGNTSLYWSVGELTVSTLVGSPYQITQGFWQPEVVDFTSANEPLQAEYGISCRPNPVVDALQITFTLEKPINVALYSLDGRLLLQQSNIESGHVLSLAHLPASLYLLQCTTEDNKWILTQKIVKQ
jgi:hypothetical protein